MELKFNVKKIRTLEKQTGKSLQKLLEDLSSIDTIVEFVKVAMDLNDDEACKEVDTYLESNDIFGLLAVITESLQGAGFLPRQINLKETTEKALKKALK